MEEDIWAQRRVAAINRPLDSRNPYQRDRARVIHSASFRRLQSKTQVLGVGESDFHRTRLTHSLEVAQIGGGIVNQLKALAIHRNEKEFIAALPQECLIEVICLSHDIGHPPFGHAGESTLDFLMREYGGFEGNGQTLRVLSNLESHTKDNGLNLTRRTLLGLLKYPAPYSKASYRSFVDVSTKRPPENWIPPKCYFDSESILVDWVLEPFGDEKVLFVQTESKEGQQHHTKYKSLDTSIMELADDIAYGVHDLEDAVALNLIQRSDWNDLNIKKEWLVEKKGMHIENSIFSNNGYLRKQAIGDLVNRFMTSIGIKKISGFTSPLLKWNVAFDSESQEILKQLKQLVMNKVILLPKIQMASWRGQEIIRKLFHSFVNYPKTLLRTKDYKLYQLETELGNERGAKRVICDFIAGMTDEYAIRMYERLFIPRHGNIFDHL